MKALIQRVKKASVTVENEIIGHIDQGILILLGIGKEDASKDIQYIIEKILNLRIFPNNENKLDLSIQDIKGELLIVSQFTLYGNVKKGRRPDFTDAADPQKAKVLYNEFIEEIRKSNLTVAEGKFATMMDVELINDGPVTLIIDSATM